MLAHHKGTTFHQQLATTPALSSATCVPARSYRTFGIVHFARPFQPGRKRSEKANTQSHNVPYKLQTATHVFLGAKQSETTIKNAASGCWMMLGCWDVDACYNMLQCWVKQQAPKLLSYLRSSSWPIRQLQALRPQKTWAESRGIHICSLSAQNSKDRRRYVLTFWWHTQCINILVADFSSQRQWVADFSINSCSRQRFVGDLHLLLRCLVGMISNNPTSDSSNILR